MSLFAKAERRAVTMPSLEEILRTHGVEPRARAGVAVSADSAMRLSTVWACTRLLSDLVSGLPVDIYRRNPDGTRTEVDPPPVVANPSGIVSQLTWRYQLMMSLLLRGNAFGIVVARDRRMVATQVELLHPDTVTVTQEHQLAPPTYAVDRQPVPTEDIWHVSAYNVPGSVVGMSPVTYARSTFGTALAANTYAESFWRDGGHPTSVVSTDQMIDQATAEAVKDRFKRATANDKLAVLGSGFKYESIQVSPDDAGWLDSINATDLQVCRFFGVPGEMVNVATSGSSVTYANREQRVQDLLAFTAQFWFTRVEEAWSALLTRPTYVKHNLAALLRPDTKTRAEVAQLRLRNGITNVDYERELDDLAPLPDGAGQQYVWPPAGVQMTQEAPSGP